MQSLKKPLLYVFLAIFLGATIVYGVRTLRRALRKHHAAQVELARVEWAEQTNSNASSSLYFRNRFSECDDALLLHYFNLKRDRKTKTIKTETKLDTWNRFLPLFEQWPQGLRTYCEKYVSHVYVVSLLGSSAYALQQNDSSFTILIDRDAMESLPNDWFTNKERTAVNLTSGYTINHRMEADSNNRPEFTLETLLIHEVAHCIGITTKQTRKFDASWLNINQNSLLEGVFQVVNVSMEMTSENQKGFAGLHYYRNQQLSTDEYIKRLSSLRNSPFPTMYSSVNDLEYFADYFYAYVHCVLQQRPLEYSVYKDGQKTVGIDCGISLPHHQKRRDIISRILSELDN
ncbi:MAG: hypothetical protein K9G41_02500 [Flavobacteriales bacterium]|nr:hypothetical protein [Flavobacteriales bacterium]